MLEPRGRVSTQTHNLHHPWSWEHRHHHRQARQARKRFPKNGGEDVEYLLLQRIWRSVKRLSTTKGTERLMSWWEASWNMLFLSGRSRGLLKSGFLIRGLRTKWKGEERERCTRIRSICFQSAVSTTNGGKGVYVFSDSVLCLGKVRPFPQSNDEWRVKLEWFMQRIG